jgi:hypothetical protein
MGQGGGIAASCDDECARSARFQATRAEATIPYLILLFFLKLFPHNRNAGI